MDFYNEVVVRRTFVSNLVRNFDLHRFRVVFRHGNDVFSHLLNVSKIGRIALFGCLTITFEL